MLILLVILTLGFGVQHVESTTGRKPPETNHRLHFLHAPALAASDLANTLRYVGLSLLIQLNYLLNSSFQG